MTDARAARPPAEDTGFAAFRRWWGDHALAQAIGLAAAAVAVAFLASNVVASMRRLGMSPSFDYLTQPANFDISESLIAYRAGDPYSRAILVGLLNTIKLAVSGCGLATLLGVSLGLMRAAGNPLLARLVDAYVEIVRNTPLVLQLFFWIALTHALPPVRQALQPLPFDLSLGARRLSALAHGRWRRDLADRRLFRPARAGRSRDPQAPGTAALGAEWLGILSTAVDRPGRPGSSSKAPG